MLFNECDATRLLAACEFNEIIPHSDTAPIKHVVYRIDQSPPIITRTVDFVCVYQTPTATPKRVEELAPYSHNLLRLFRWRIWLADNFGKVPCMRPHKSVFVLFFVQDVS